MVVKLKPETESLLQELAATTGRAAVDGDQAFEQLQKKNQSR